MTEILDDNKLSLLPTIKFYNKLDNAENSCQGNKFYNEAEALLKHYSGLQGVTDKILKGLCYAYGDKFQGESDIDICNFLYYWLGDILYNKLTNIIHFENVITNLFVLLRINNSKNCTAPTYYNFFEWKYFKDIKLFFDYSKDYDTYEEQITDNNLPCNKKYYEYLQKYVKAYKDYEGKCKNGQSSSGYCKAFNEYFDKKDRTNLSNWACKLPNNEAAAERTFGETQDMEEQGLPAHGGREESVTLPEGSEEGRKQDEKGLSSLVQPSSKEITELSSDSPPSYDPPTPTITKSIVTAASAAGFLLPPFLIYNFTPVRSWISKLLGRNPIYRNPLTERELIENSYQPDNFDSETNRYNISYRPE